MPSLLLCARRVAALIAIAALASFAVSTQSRADVPRHGAAGSTATPSISAPTTAVEGTAFAVTVRVPRPRTATTIVLQFHDWHNDEYDSTLKWTKKTSARVQGRGTVVFHVRADDAREAWFRAVIAYTGTTRRATSVARRVNYQHWFPLSSFSRYYDAGDAIDLESFQMAGRAWNGWFADGSAGESRYTLGSACVRIRATIGVTDSSSDGATGKITLATIAPGGTATTFYTSPTLVAGKTVSINRVLASPYRFSIIGQDTTPAVTDGSPQPRAYPAVGDPEFLCHFN